MSSHLLILGSGASAGIPVIGCDCAVCQSNLPFNQRLRTAALLFCGPHRLLIDVGPDFRQQALKFGIRKLDGVLFTHAHSDHTAGIDELRAFYLAVQKPLPCLMSKETYAELKQRFSYIFCNDGNQKKFISRLEVNLLQSDHGSVDFLGHEIRYVSYEQGGMQVNGFCIGNLAYISDIRHYSDAIFKELGNITYLIISALRFTPSHLHFTVDEAIDFASKVGAKKTWLTHLSHDLDHEKTQAYLPEGLNLAYDGLKIAFQEQ